MVRGHDDFQLLDELVMGGNIQESSRKVVLNAVGLSYRGKKTMN